MKKTIVIGSDHAGYQMKQKVIQALSDQYEFIDVGTNSEGSTDYPIYAKKVGEYIQQNPGAQGVLLCGNGVGITMAANKMKGIRAALGYSKESAQQTRQHNDANVVAVGGRSPMMDDPVEIVKMFLETDFSDEERHVRRVNQIMELEKTAVSNQ